MLGSGIPVDEVYEGFINVSLAKSRYLLDVATVGTLYQAIHNTTVGVYL